MARLWKRWKPAKPFTILLVNITSATHTQIMGTISIKKVCTDFVSYSAPSLILR